MGIPDTILYKTGEEAHRIFKIAYVCEPTPDADSAAMANALIRLAPVTAGITDPEEQRTIETLAYTLSRALIGNELADNLQFPKTRTLGTLFLYRWRHRIRKILKGKGSSKLETFNQLLQVSTYDQAGLSYKMPDHVKHALSNPW